MCLALIVFCIINSFVFNRSDASTWTRCGVSIYTPSRLRIDMEDSPPSLSLISVADSKRKGGLSSYFLYIVLHFLHKVAFVEIIRHVSRNFLCATHLLIRK